MLPEESSSSVVNSDISSDSDPEENGNGNKHKNTLPPIHERDSGIVSSASSSEAFAEEGKPVRKSVEQLEALLKRLNDRHKKVKDPDKSKAEEGEVNAREDKALKTDQTDTVLNENDFIYWETSPDNLNKKIPVVRFHCQTLSKAPLPNSVGSKYRLTFKTVNADAKLVSQICHAHGFHEVMASNSDYNLMWTGVHPKLHSFKSMLPHQRVNHFPRSYELTRKDRLYQNIERLQHAKGAKHFNFVPKTFVIPSEYSEFAATHHRTRGAWIVKPVASSRGRGIFIVNHPNQVPLDEPMVVAKYIDNPLLVNGHKWDLRLYVAVTSYDPLVIYLYEEGLVRFATVRYDSSGKNLWNPCMHLCNYSINKYHSDYVKCDDPDTEDRGHKWSLSALLRHLKANSIDTAALMHSIEDVIIKSIISVEFPVNSACKMFVPHRRNCFEIYGFDILIDSELKPWLLEVNLSPSLNCDAPIDLKIKSALICDLMSLVGIQAIDPALRRAQFNQRILNSYFGSNFNRRNGSEEKPLSKRSLSLETRIFSAVRLASSNISASQELSKIVRTVKDENARRGGFVRIFPTADTWQAYGPILEYSSPNNQMLHECLFPESFKKSGMQPRLRRKSVVVKELRKRSQSAGPSSKDARIDIEEICQTKKSGEEELPIAAVSEEDNRKNEGNKENRDPPKPTASELRVAQYEKPLMKGYRTKSSGSKDPEKLAKKRSEKKERSAVLRTKISKMIESGLQLSEYQARKSFFVYLQCILRRLSDLDESNNADLTQVDLVLKFLQKAALSLREPYFLKAPSIKLGGKDRAAIVAKELNEFLGHYKRETELYTVYKEDKSMIPRHIFEEFIAFANDSDLEEVLTLQTKLYRCAHIFLGKCLPPVTGRKNSLLRTAYGISPDRNLRDKQCSMRMNARANPPVAPQYALPPQPPSKCLDISTALSEDGVEDEAEETDMIRSKFRKKPFEKATITRIGVANTLYNGKKYQEYPHGKNPDNSVSRSFSAPFEILPKK